MQSTLWSYAAPADRKPLASAFFAWLLDANGTHHLGTRVLKLFYLKCSLELNEVVDVRVLTKQSPSRDRRFDMTDNHGDTSNLVIETKCKTFGSREQLERYAAKSPVAMWAGFSEMNCPELTDTDRHA